MTAAVIALLAALCFALSTVTQHRAAGRVAPSTGAGSPPLWRLAANPLWLLGVLAGAAALALQALALSLGQLVVVQPLLVTGMLFAIPASVLLERSRPRLDQWAWAVAVVVGVVVFLTAAHPARGTTLADLGLLAATTSATGAAGALAVALAFGPGRHHRAWLLGLAAGTAFGLTSVLLKQVVGQLSASPDRLLTSWPGYGLVVVGLAGVALAQLSYRAGSLAASQPALTIAEPLVAVLIGSSAFGEQLAASPGARMGQLLGSALLAVAVLRLAVLTRATSIPSPSSTTQQSPETR